MVNAMRTAKLNLKPESRQEVRQWRCSAAYKRLRERVMRKQPLCQACARKGLIRAGVEMDHIKPIKGRNFHLFWAEDNLQMLCRECHQTKTESEKVDKKRLRFMTDFDKLTERYAPA